MALKESQIFGDAHFDKTVRVKVLKLLEKTLKEESKTIAFYKEKILDILYYCLEKPQLIPLVCTTSILNDVHKRVCDEYYFLKNEKYISRIAKQQQKILEIETIESDNYCVVCPRNYNDLLDEGRQQNNCVGYHYNRNIANGEDYIYFIRKKSNKNKSFITC